MIEKESYNLKDNVNIDGKTCQQHNVNKIEGVLEANFKDTLSTIIALYLRKVKRKLIKIGFYE